MAGVVFSGEVRKFSGRETRAVVGDDSLRETMACDMDFNFSFIWAVVVEVRLAYSM